MAGAAKRAAKRVLRRHELPVIRTPVPPEASGLIDGDGGKDPGTFGPVPDQYDTLSESLNKQSVVLL